MTKENISENSYSASRDVRLFPLNLTTFDVDTPTASACSTNDHNYLYDRFLNTFHYLLTNIILRHNNREKNGEMNRVKEQEVTYIQLNVLLINR